MEPPYEFVCIDCNTPVTRWGRCEPSETLQRCMVCWWITITPNMTEQQKQQLREWDNGGELLEVTEAGK